MTSFVLNGKPVTVQASPDTPLLWVLRDELQLMGSKFGCGAGLCGACSVLFNGQSIRSCVMPVAAIAGQKVTTIEGLGGEHPVQKAWIDNDVAQCGYCQSGQIISSVALLAENPKPSEEQIKAALAGNICRCGSYPKIIQALQQASQSLAATDPAELFYDASSAAKQPAGDLL